MILRVDCRRSACCRLFFVVSLIALLSAVDAVESIGASAGAAPRSPNIVVILADDMGWGDLSVHGNKNIRTPRIDELARAGVRFDRFFVCPVCAPTRAEFLTGRYYPRTGVHGVSTGAERMDTDEKTLAQYLKEAGYATGMFGKWHNGTQFPYHPNARGFDEYYGFCSGHWGNYFDPVLEHNNRLVRGKGYITDDLTTHAMEFIEQHKQEPFFCYVAYNTPHSPFQVPERFYERFRNKPLRSVHRDPRREDVAVTRAALAMCENVDWNVGRLLDRLEQLSLSDNTIVVFFSDNGPNSWRYNGGMKGRKGSVDEGGVRVPCFVRWPGHLAAGRNVRSIAGALDLLPTLLDLAGVDYQPARPLDGISLRPVMTSETAELPDRTIVSYFGRRVSVRNQRFRLGPKGQLFDMRNDPGQRIDVRTKFPKEAAVLDAARKSWRSDVLAELPKEDRRPFPIGGAERTWLPARDGVPHGAVHRSGRAPNCSYFTGWKRKDDRLTWHVDVLEPGEYEVVLFYTCRPKNVGVRIVTKLGQASLAATVDKPHDPPLRGMEHDRAYRGSESYVKTFKPWSMGRVKLKKGAGELTLRAVDIPGEEAIEVRWVELIRK